MSTQEFPEDFDDIVARSAASAFSNLTSWSGHFFTATGPTNASTFVPAEMWPIIHADILKQCDTGWHGRQHPRGPKPLHLPS